jgi:hypothetical protein
VLRFLAILPRLVFAVLVYPVARDTGRGWERDDSFLISAGVLLFLLWTAWTWVSLLLLGQ